MRSEALAAPGPGSLAHRCAVSGLPLSVAPAKLGAQPVGPATELASARRVGSIETRRDLEQPDRLGHAAVGDLERRQRPQNVRNVLVELDRLPHLDRRLIAGE